MVAGESANEVMINILQRIVTYTELGRSKGLSKSVSYEVLGSFDEPIVTVEEASLIADAAMEASKSMQRYLLASKRMLAGWDLLA
jgi:hypothetical protein